MKYKVIKELTYLKFGIKTQLSIGDIIESSEDTCFASYIKFFLNNNSIMTLSDNNIKHITSIVTKQEQSDEKDDEDVANEKSDEDEIVEDEQSDAKDDEDVANEKSDEDEIVEDEQSDAKDDEDVEIKKGKKGNKSKK